MYDSKRIKKEDPITLDYILSRVTEYDIYARYIGQFKIGYIYNSPFREDKNPSFGIFRSRKTGKLLFKDHGNGLCGDVIRFVQEYTGITNYNELLKQIVKDLNIKNNTVLKSTKAYEKSEETVIGVVRQEFTNVDKEFWQQFEQDLNKLEQKLVVELTALPNVRWWHRNIARQGFSINGFIKHYPDILIMTQSGKLICAETKGDHLKNDDSREKIALGQAWRTAAGKDFRYYMVFENEENLLPGAMSMSQFIDTVKAL